MKFYPKITKHFVVICYNASISFFLIICKIIKSLTEFITSTVQYEHSDLAIHSFVNSNSIHHITPFLLKSLIITLK